MSTPSYEGFRANHKGHLVPVETIRPIDLARDDFVAECYAKGLALQQQMAAFKAELLGDIGAFVDLALERYGASLGGEKGNIQLTSYDGQTRVLLAVQDSIAFDEGLVAAKALVDECVREWTEGSRPEIQAIINDAFQTDKAGLISTTRVIGLRRLNINDEKWLRAMQALSDSLKPQCSKEYVRVERRNAGGRWEALRFDLAGV